jgi:hypothetical protein
MLANIISAIIAASIALIVAGLGHWQWRRQQASAISNEYNVKRAETLNVLWEKLTDHSMVAHTTKLSPGMFYRAVQDLNFFLIKGSPFLTDSEKELARRYLEAVYTLRAIVEESRDEAALDALVTSRKLDLVEIKGSLELGSTAQRLEDALAKHIQETLLTRNLDHNDADKILLEMRQAVTKNGETFLPQSAVADRGDITIIE